MKKKLISLGMVAAMTAGLFVGCGSASDGSKGAATENGKETVSIYVYGNDQEQAMYQQLFDKFAEENNCVVDAQFSIKDDYGTTITGMMTAKNLPDVFYMGPENVKAYVDNGYVLDMTPVLESEGLDTSDIVSGALGAYAYEGGQYGLPHDASVFAYAYNKDLFDEAGLEYPNPDKPYTYDEFVEVCKALTKDKDGDGELDQWGCAFWPNLMVQPFLYSNGASFLTNDYKTVNITDPNFEDALQKMVDLTLVHKVTPTVEQEAANGLYQRWLDGQVAFYACGTWDIAAFMDKEVFKYDWDLCAYPTLSSGQTYAWCGTVGYCVSSATKNEALATKLAYYMSASDDAMKLLSGIEGGQSIQIPNLVSMADNEFASAVADGSIPYASNYNVIFDYLNNSNGYNSRFNDETFTPNAEWLNLFFEGLDNVRNGSIDVKSYCEDLQPKMQELLDEAYEDQ